MGQKQQQYLILYTSYQCVFACVCVSVRVHVCVHIVAQFNMCCLFLRKIIYLHSYIDMQVSVTESIYLNSLFLYTTGLAKLETGIFTIISSWDVCKNNHISQIIYLFHILSYIFYRVLRAWAVFTNDFGWLFAYLASHFLVSLWGVADAKGFAALLSSITFCIPHVPQFWMIKYVSVVIHIFSIRIDNKL